MSMVYAVMFLAAFLITFLTVPLVRSWAVRWNVWDRPDHLVKTHGAPVPYLGGLAVFLGFAGSLLLLRFFSDFPTGTLRSLRGLLVGGGVLLLVGLADDLRKPRGLSVRAKFAFQVLAAFVLMHFDMKIRFIHPDWLATVATVLWVVGISNAINLIDIMDGLASSQTLVAALGFLLISIPTEQIYVNVAATALAGASLAFIPHNMSRTRRIFMGDMGSLFLGVVLAGLSLGTDYTKLSEVGVFAPLLVLGLPVYDTFFVSVLRLKDGKSPFQGSKDHLALKLRAGGRSVPHVVILFASASVVLSVCAWLLTKTPLGISLWVISSLLLVGLGVLIKLAKVVVH